MNQSISRFFIEIFFVASFAVAVAFLIRIYSSSGTSVSSVSEWARQGDNVQESPSAKADAAINTLVDTGNTVNGSSLYYDIISAAESVSDDKAEIYIGGRNVDAAAIQDAIDGNPNDLMNMIDANKIYVKTYGTDGQKQTITYTECD